MKEKIEQFKKQVLENIYHELDQKEFELTLDITVNGKTLSLPLHADLYQNLERLLDEELEDMKQ
ncbi:hypothetical protein PUS82_00535 [Cytobacillus firmus]|uniref:hypothetical protein n=1 Tax=Cytobacillus firmus TaxID=1399 RepID=UPI00237B3F3D|nr:hypothetical protein [Cytobacillus firmus]MDD9309818.1 hypothetical protein [Cytobacillus firmus]